MKYLPTLTAAFVLLIAGGYRAASALQEKSDPPENVQKTSPQDPSAKTVETNDPEAVELVQQARNQLFARESVQAEMVESISLGNYTFQTSGAYASASGFRFRLEYQVEVGDLRGTFLEVCDGQVLHTRRQIEESSPKHPSTDPPDVELSRRDVQKIRREAMTLKETKTGAELADALRAAEIGIGGLPAVLASLERSMIFDAVRPETVNGQEYLVVQGRWRPDRRDRLMQGLGGAGGQVANFVPDLVRIYFSRQTLFPEKFLYLKQTDKDQKSFRPMVTVEFRNVVLDQPVPDRLFVYVAPPGMEEKDDTATYLEGMRQTIEPAASPKKQPSGS